MTQDDDGNRDSGSDDCSEDDSEDSSDDDDDDEETRLLMAELEKIKKERQHEAEAKRKAATDAAIRAEGVLVENPLLSDLTGGDSGGADGFGVKRRWDADIVFRNQAKLEDVGRKKKRFINDAIRSDFHRRFLDRYACVTGVIVCSIKELTFLSGTFNYSGMYYRSALVCYSINMQPTMLKGPHYFS